MNWLVIGGGALIVIWLAGRRVAKRDAATPEPIFGSGDGAGSTGAGGDAYYGGGGGGDGGLSLAGPTLAPIGSDIRPSGLKDTFLQGTFVNAIGRGKDPMTVLPMDELPVSAKIAAATIAAATSNSTELGSSSRSMSQLASTANNDRAVSVAVQTQPPRSFSSLGAAISEKNMSPLMLEKTATPVAMKTVSLPGELSKSMTLGQSFVSSIRPAAISLRPISLTSAVRR